MNDFVSNTHGSVYSYYILLNHVMKEWWLKKIKSIFLIVVIDKFNISIDNLLKIWFFFNRNNFNNKSKLHKRKKRNGRIGELR